MLDLKQDRIDAYYDMESIIKEIIKLTQIQNKNFQFSSMIEILISKLLIFSQNNKKLSDAFVKIILNLMVYSVNLDLRVFSKIENIKKIAEIFANFSSKSDQNCLTRNFCKIVKLFSNYICQNSCLEFTISKVKSMIDTFIHCIEGNQKLNYYFCILLYFYF